jgi:valine--pyruvate aminotransferase
MNVSKFGRKLAVPSGIGQLMDDLGEAEWAEHEVLMLGGGNPAHIPEVQHELRRSMTALLAAGNRFERAIGSYDPPAGNGEFTAAIAHLLRDRYGWALGPENVALTNGSQSLFFILLNLFAGEYEDGTAKKILFPLVPEYIGYCDVGLSEGLFTTRKPRIERLDEHTFKYYIDFEGLRVADDLGAICVSRPTNPTGNVLTREELERLNRLALGRGIPLILDNAYGPPFPNIVFAQAEPLWNENMIVCLSLSKLGLPGVRTGIVIARREVIEMVARVNAVMSLAPGGIGPALLTDLVGTSRIIALGRDIIQPFYRTKMQEALALIHRHFAGLDYRVHQPEGAFFVWLWFPNLPITSQQLYERLKQRRVLVIPGHHFFPGLTEPWPHTHECLRVNYAQEHRVVAAGMEAIAAEVRRAWEERS